MRAIWRSFLFVGGFFVCFCKFKTPQVPQLFTRILQQHCLAVKLLQCFVDWQTLPNFLLTPCFYFWVNSSFNRSVKSDRFPAEQYWFSQNNQRCLPHWFTVLKVTGFFVCVKKFITRNIDPKCFCIHCFYFVQLNTCWNKDQCQSGLALPEWQTCPRLPNDIRRIRREWRLEGVKQTIYLCSYSVFVKVTFTGLWLHPHPPCS